MDSLFSNLAPVNGICTLLCNAIAQWYVCAYQPQLAPPPTFLQELFDLLATEGGVLSVNISSGAPHLKKIDSWLITLDESWCAISLQTAKCVVPQSIRMRNCFATVVGDIHSYPLPLITCWPFFHCTGAGSINLHTLHFFTTILTSALSMLGLTILVK